MSMYRNKKGKCVVQLRNAFFLNKRSFSRTKGNSFSSSKKVSSGEGKHSSSGFFSGIVVKALDMPDLLRAPLSPLPGGDIQFPERLRLFLTSWIDKSPEVSLGKIMIASALLRAHDIPILSPNLGRGPERGGSKTYGGSLHVAIETGS